MGVDMDMGRMARAWSHMQESRRAGFSIHLPGLSWLKSILRISKTGHLAGLFPFDFLVNMYLLFLSAGVA